MYTHYGFKESPTRPHLMVQKQASLQVFHEAVDRAEGRKDIFGWGPPRIEKQAAYDESKEWIGVDLDGCLAKYYEWKGRAHIGSPIPAMVNRVKQWLKEGKQVKIFTARVSGDDGKARYHIRKWCTLHLGCELPITCVKDRYCKAIYDDRAKGVTKNKGKVKAISKHAGLAILAGAVNLAEGGSISYGDDGSPSCDDFHHFR